MAAYDTLRAAIDNYIKANGNKEITGTVLNDILNAMVSALGADTRFAGVAVPSTNPGNPEGNVVYFASQAGTYSNFGGIVLTLGIHILVWNGTAWTSQTWFSVDNTPTQNSQNLATSGGILQAIVDAVGVERLRAIGAEVTSCSFDGTTKKISFFNSANTTLFQLDATAFVIDGMVNDVKIEDGNLVIQFNTDAGKQDIEIPLTDIFNPANYYTKTAIDALLASYYTKTEVDGLLNTINSKLAEGYLYKGIATSSTAPGTPTTKVFYIATQAGTYTNFGNIAVIEGITILKYDGSNWIKEQLQGVDNEPTEGSNNLVKSGGVFNETHSMLDYTSDIEIEGFIVRDFSNYSQGDIAPFSGCKTSKPIKVNRGDKVSFVLGIGSAGMACALYSSTNTDNTTYVKEILNGGVIDTDGYVRFCYQAELTPNPSFVISRSVSEATKENIRDIEILKRQIDNTDDEPTEGSNNLVKSGGVFNETHSMLDYTSDIEIEGFIVRDFSNYSQGDIAPFSGCKTSKPIKVNRGDKVSFVLGIGSAGMACALYSNYTADSSSFVKELVNNETISVEGYVRFCYQENSTPEPSFIIISSINTKIVELENEINNVEILNFDEINNIEFNGFIVNGTFQGKNTGDIVIFADCFASYPIKVLEGDIVKYNLNIGSAGLKCALYSDEVAEHSSFIKSIASDDVIDRDGYIRFCYNTSTSNPAFVIIRTIKKAVISNTEDIRTIGDEVERLNNTVQIYLPKKLYVAVGVNCCIYHYGIADILYGLHSPLFISGAGKNYKDLWKYEPSVVSANANLEVICRNFNLNNVASTNNKTILVTVPQNGLSGTKTILFCGSSHVQQGTYVPMIYNMFTDCAINLIGRWGWNVNSWREGQGSMPVTGYLYSQGVCYLCQVTGLTEEASVGLVTGGSKYKDSNDVEFECHENRAINGVGYMVLWGSTTPAIGTLTKISGSGSDSVTITSFEEIDKNPFWNPSENKVDFNWYLTKYGFNTPDIVVFDEWTNTASGNLSVSEFVNLYKLFVDTLHSQIPNCKIIMNMSCRGVYSPDNDFYSMNKKVRKYWHPMRELFEGEAYNSFVFLNTNSAWVSPEKGFNTDTITVNSLTGETEIVQYDDIHRNAVGSQQCANAFYSAIRGLLLDI